MPVNKNVPNLVKTQIPEGAIQVTKLKAKRPDVKHSKLLLKTSDGNPYGWECFTSPNEWAWGLRLNAPTQKMDGSTTIRCVLESVSAAVILNNFDLQNRYTGREISIATTNNMNNKPRWFPVLLVNQPSERCAQQFRRMSGLLLAETLKLGERPLIDIDTLMAVRQPDSLIQLSS